MAGLISENLFLSDDNSKISSLLNSRHNYVWQKKKSIIQVSFWINLMLSLLISNKKLQEKSKRRNKVLIQYS